MKLWNYSCLIMLILSACQTQVPRSILPSQSLTQLSAATTNRPNLNPQLMQELQTPDQEGEPTEIESASKLDENLIRKTIGASYIQAHHYYFSVQDQGQSTIESILAHDQHHRPAQLVKRWAKTLSEGALWPDQQSTTYKGRWPALEHAELKRSGGWFQFQSASVKADEYYQLAKKAWKPQLAADHPDQTEAWAWLGRASHFLQDVTVPFHTVSLLRPSQLLYHTAYEKSCDQLFWNYLPSRNVNPGGVWVHGPYPEKGTWGLYFNPGTSAGQMIKQNADYARRFYKLVNEGEDWSSLNWERTRAVMVPLGAKTTAGLILEFLRDVQAN